MHTLSDDFVTYREPNNNTDLGNKVLQENNAMDNILQIEIDESGLFLFNWWSIRKRVRFFASGSYKILFLDALLNAHGAANVYQNDIHFRCAFPIK